MDPRHPELAISRMRELMKQYDRIESDIAHATTSSKLGQLEREGGLVVQEICLVAPRMHESLIQSSRQRRHNISRGIIENPYEKMRDYAATAVREEEVVVGPTDQIIAINEATTEEAEIVEKPAEKSFHRADIVTNVENPYGETAVHDAKPEEYIEMAEVLDHSMTEEQKQIFEEMTKPKATRKKKTRKKKED